jgi:hypothetical protein
MPDYASMNFSIIKKSYQNGFGPENQNALFKGYYKSVLKLWICTSYSAINDNGNFCFGIILTNCLVSIDAIEWVEITSVG